MEEGEGEYGDGYYAPDVQEFGYQGISVFAMGSPKKVSLCDKARLSERISRGLASACSVHLLFDQIERGLHWGSTPLFPYSM